MKLKIEIEVPMNQERHRSKALRAAASINGVSSLSIESETNKLVVMGDGVDPVRLTALLRKKFDYANILAVEEVKPPPEKEEEEEEEEEAEPEKPAVSDPVIKWHPCYSYWYHEYPRHYVWPAAYDSSPSYCKYL